MTGNRLHLEAKPHYIYLHRDPAGTILYVGRTADPKRRPYESTGRAWMREHQTTVEIQGPMPYEEACQAEADAIEEHSPRFNVARGWDNVKRTNEFVRLLMEQGMERRNAKYLDRLISEMPPEQEQRTRAHHLSVLRGEIEPVPAREALGASMFGMPSRRPPG